MSVDIDQAGRLALLLVGGVIAGATNTLAGGGSLLTLPLLIFAGLPPVVANATNRVAVLAQTSLSAWTFHRAGKVPWRLVLRLAPATLAGAATGASLASRLPNEAFKPVLVVAIVSIALFLALAPARFAEGARSDTPPKVTGRILLLFFLMGAWGGFLQAGLGFFLIGTLSIALGRDLVTSNAIKVSLACMLTLLSLGIFLGAGQVAWLQGLTLAVGMGSGGLLGSRLALRKGSRWLRWVVLVAAVVSAVAVALS